MTIDDYFRTLEKYKKIQKITIIYNFSRNKYVKTLILFILNIFLQMYLSISMYV